MDVRTRLCLRDGFRRLAGNALHRHTANDCGGSKGKINEPNNWSESSSSNDKACCQRYSYFHPVEYIKLKMLTVVNEHNVSWCVGILNSFCSI